MFPAMEPDQVKDMRFKLVYLPCTSYRLRSYTATQTIHSATRSQGDVILALRRCHGDTHQHLLKGKGCL